MTARETYIAKRILTALHALDGGQAHALTLHADLGGLSLCPSSEFEEALQILDVLKLVTGVTTKFRGTLWSITALGEATRREM